MDAGKDPPLDDEPLDVRNAADAGSGQPSGPDRSQTDVAQAKLDALFEMLRPPQDDPTNAADGPEPGETLGEFRLIRRLASGGMGSVFLAEQQSLDRIVAVKICRPEIASNPDLRERFCREGKLLAAFRHPHIVPVLTTGEDKGYAYLVMEYIPGRDLHQILEAIRAAPSDLSASEVVSSVIAGQATPLSRRPTSTGHARLDPDYIKWVLTTVNAIATGLAEIHSQRLLHLDLKPANILVEPNGQPRIVDFGLAMPEPEAQLPSSGRGFWGTPDYAAPEHFDREFGEFSPATDVFSLGIILFECLTLDRPFKGKTLQEISQAICSTRAPPLRKVNRRVNWELEAIATQCLQRKPSDRYRGGNDVAEDLARFIESRPVRAKTSLLRRIRYWSLQNPYKVGCSVWWGLILVVMVTGGIFGLVKGGGNEKDDAFCQAIDEADATFFLAVSTPAVEAPQHERQYYRENAIESYTAALSKYPSSWAYTQRGILLLESSGSVKDAASDFEAAARLDPSFASIHTLLAVAYEKLDRRADANQSRLRAQRIYPVTAQDLYWLGIVSAYMHRDATTANFYWSNCLLLKPQPYVQGHRFAARSSTDHATHNLHFLARAHRSKDAGLGAELAGKERALCASLRPDFWKMCQLLKGGDAQSPVEDSTNPP